MYRMIMICFFLFLEVNAIVGCKARNFGFESIVCVCNAKYCDDIPERGRPPKGAFFWYASDISGKRMHFTVHNINIPLQRHQKLFLNRAERYQRIRGWGGAFTDSSGINIQKLSSEAQNQIMKTYFSKSGSRYNYARVPIAGTDFSTRGYTYDDFDNDNDLQNFALQMEDLYYKIPYIKKALQINPELMLISAAWTAPAWMKTNNLLNQFGFLKKEHYQTYANYLIKFLDEYKKHDIDYSGISTGNEPTLTTEYPLTMNSMSWTSGTLAKWISENFGPTLTASKHNKTRIHAFDDQRTFLPYNLEMLFKNEKAKNYVGDIALHWYWDNIDPPELLDRTHELFPDKPMFMSEACTGFQPTDIPKVRLGAWFRAENYTMKIIENMNHWVTGWVDWNLVLDKTGGPNWIKNNVDAPVIVNPETDEFFKQPTYYSITHFSRFVPRGSTKIKICNNVSNVEATAFETPDNDIVVVLCSTSDIPQEITIYDAQGNGINITLSPHSFNTIIYNGDQFVPSNSATTQISNSQNIKNDNKCQFTPCSIVNNIETPIYTENLLNYNYDYN